MSDAEATVKTDPEDPSAQKPGADPKGKSKKTGKTVIITKMVGTIGGLSSFDPEKDNFDDWKIIFESYLKANDLDSTTDTKGKCQAILLASIGTSQVNLLKNLVAPDVLTSKPLKDLLDLLEKHHKPAPKALAERFKFMKRMQHPGESIACYLAELRKLASNCQFETGTLNGRLRDQLILGLQNERAQSNILTQDDKITLDEVIKIATAQEVAEASTALFRGMSSQNGEGGEIKKMSKFRSQKAKNKTRGQSENNSNSQQQQRSKGSSFQNSSSACSRCGSSKHQHKDCPHKDATCYNCGKTGHFSRQCRTSQNKSNSVKSVKRSANVKSAEKLIEIPVTVNGKVHMMEVDTACDMTVLSEQFWKDKLGSPPLTKSNVTFRTYTKEKFQPIGKIQAEIVYQGQTKKMWVQVGEGSSLFGKDLIKKFKLDWHQIIEKDWKQCHNVQSAIVNNEELDKLLFEYSDIFKSPEVNEKIKGFTARIQMKDDATPKFLKARPLPFAIRQQVEKELEEMQRKGEITKIDCSEWASPLVVVPKANGKIRITGDFKDTVNSQLCITQYPIAVPEDLFATVSGGDKFSKLDGSNAYHQIELEESCQKYMVINTHKGLFKYRVLPQGIASSPAIFQEFVDKMLDGLSLTGSYIDDMITTGKNDSDHIKTLRKIFERMRKFNYRLSKEKCQFLRSEIEFLGHMINKEGIMPTNEKVQDIMDMPVPKDASELRSFLGLVNFYGKFVKELGDLSEPLYNLTKSEVK